MQPNRLGLQLLFISPGGVAWSADAVQQGRQATLACMRWQIWGLGGKDETTLVHTWWRLGAATVQRLPQRQCHTHWQRVQLLQAPALCTL